MTEILKQQFNKIVIDFVTECETSTSGNKHILTIIDHLKGWPEAFPVPDKSADTIVSTFINHYLPVHMCPRYILSDSVTEFKNQRMELEVFHKYLRPTLRKLCKKDAANWDTYLNQILASYRVTPNLATAETPFSLSTAGDPNLPLHQLLEPMQ